MIKTVKDYIHINNLVSMIMLEKSSFLIFKLIIVAKTALEFCLINIYFNYLIN